MSLDKQLARWQAAGVIDADAGERIAAFEREREHPPVLLWALGGLGALTLGIGIVSVVAANWDAFGKAPKLGADLLLGASLAFALHASLRRAQTWLCDVLAGVYYAYVLASIALLGQVYQMGAPTYQALLTWSLCTAPFMLLVRGPLLATAWLCGLGLTHEQSLQALIDALRVGGHDRAFVNDLAATLGCASALLFLMVARVPWLVKQRPQVSNTWTNLLWTCVLLSGLAAGFLWYERTAASGVLSWSLAVTALLAATLHAGLPRMYPHWPARARRGHSVLVAAIWLVLASATSFEHAAANAIGAIAQVLLLGIAAWTVLALGRVRVFNTLTAVIALRILIMYFEVFGSMLDTGLGMITGGLLTLLLAWAWKRKSPELARTLTRTGA
ncbi:MAG TPA: DUF2157 domain-containing protein [Polyangiales bacterium]